MDDAFRDFQSHLKNKVVAAGISGGSDSMALCHALSSRAQHVHALTVNHNLRDEAHVEALQVGEFLSALPNVTHHILTRPKNAINDTRLQEEARKDRYALMADFCATHDISSLFIGHHEDDQAETILFRLAKGSGLDGLSGMKPVQPMDETLHLCRPFLSLKKETLIQYCGDHNLQFLSDPSNESDDFARVRLRKAAEVLAAEGLTSGRLSVMGDRMSRAREALDFYALQHFENSVEANKTDCVSFKFDAYCNAPREVKLRVLLHVFDLFSKKGNDLTHYGPRMEKVEALLQRIETEKPFKKSTLGGLIFDICIKKQRLTIEREHKAATL